MKMIHGNTIFSKLVTIGLIFSLFISGSSISKQIETFDYEIIIGPYTQNVTNISITILWETDTYTNNNRIEYGKTTNYGYIEPYSYKWNRTIWKNTAVFFRHYVEILAYDHFENIAHDKQIVWRIL